MPRLRALYERYAARHFDLSEPGLPLPGPAGYIDLIHRQGDRLILEGWSEADVIRATCGGESTATSPTLNRMDVAQALGLRADLGFRLELPASGKAEVEVMHGAETLRMAIPAPSPRAQRRAEWRCKGQFLRDLLRAARFLPAALIQGSADARTRVKSCLRLDGKHVNHAVLEDRLFDIEGLAPPPDPVPVTIVLPVYDAYDLLRGCLDALTRNTDLPWHLVIIDDASPDTRVRPFLRRFAKRHAGRVTLLENARNMGFIGAVNRGLEQALDRGDHVVLLNSDAFVPPGWASRLVRPMLVHEDVASVTPMSNDATIMTAPVICQRHDLGVGAALAADTVARSFNPEALLSVMPTGIGFCMAMNINFLRRLPKLDQTFGKGYGEEVDWCQKTRTMGGRHLGLPGLFVEHCGGESFGSEAKLALVRQNNRIISARYPDYDKEVRTFIATDPMATARLAIGIGIAGRDAKRPLPIYIAHSMGGGAEYYLADRIRSDLIAGPGAVVLRVGGLCRWHVELHTEDGIVAGDTNNFAFVLALLAPVRARDIIYSCAVGDPDPAGLPELILQLVRDGASDRLQVLVHDYFMLSPSYTLLDSDHLYRGPVGPDRTDRAHRSVRPDGNVVGIAQWQSLWAGLLAAAAEITVFSENSRGQIASVHPALENRISVKPHKLLNPVAQVPVPDGFGDVIGILGNIGIQKGADVVARLARKTGARPDDPRIALLGMIDPAYTLPPEVVVTGSYHPKDIGKLARRHGVTKWLIPSIWPETFSYTTHEALATGLPVYAFDIGAQGEAVARAENGVAIPFDPSCDLAELVLEAIQPQAIRAVA